MKKFLVIIFLLTTWGSILYSAEYKRKSVLSDGSWIKIATEDRGIVKITYDQLRAWGIESPKSVAVYGNGGYSLPEMNEEYYCDDLCKLPVLHAKDNNKDCIYFYSTGTLKWSYNADLDRFVKQQNNYSAKVYFFLTDDKSPSNAPAATVAPEGESDVTFTSFNNYMLYEEELINPTKSGSVWYADRIFMGSAKNINLTTDKDFVGENAVLTVSGTAHCNFDNWFSISVNGASLGSLPLPERKTDKNMYPISNSFDFKIKNNLNIKVDYEIDGPSGDAYLDYIMVNYEARLEEDDGHMMFRNAKALEYDVVSYELNFQGTEVYLWNVTDHLKPMKVNMSKTGSSYLFKDRGSLSEYVAFDTKSIDLGSAEFVGEVSNQNIHALPIYNMIIVSHPDFIDASEDLAEFHRTYDDLSVLVVPTNMVYNEFSSGAPDAGGIRNMLRMFYERGQGAEDSLRYVLLMGDGSYDNINRTNNKNNFIPTYQSVPRLDRFRGLDGTSFVTDDFYVLLDPNEGGMDGRIDLGIGRIPCQNQSEAALVVEKTISYAMPDAMGDWRNVITFMADDEDGNTYMKQSEALAGIVHENFSGFNIDKIYFDSYRQVKTSGGDLYPDANKAINQSVEKGTLILNYIGHANEISLADEDVLGINDIRSWSNKDKLPVFVTATCEFSRYDSDKMSAGEEILFNPAGGGVALFSTTRLVWSGSNYRLSQNFYRSVFKHDEDGNNIRMGDIIRLAKRATSNNNYNTRSFSLLGDPALRLAFPRNKVVTSKVNGMDISNNVDTIQFGALDKVTVQGFVTDNFGTVLSDYTGSIEATVFDKEINVETFNNDDVGVFNYPVRNNVIYKGVANAKNGEFSFSFIVPKDITYNLGTGKIFYYTEDGEMDGNGATEEFLIGGSSENPVIDNDAPEIHAYLNNEDFRSYDRISTSALLIADFYDESGINTVGTGFGHDITATLNDDYSNQIILNDFYKAEPDTYQEGKIIYPLNNLEPGEHKLTLKAWDVQNNSHAVDIYFVVEDGFKIVSVSNYPNPVTFSTEFNIEHNLPGDVFETSIEIFNLRGMRIHTIEQVLGSYGTTETSLKWDITDTKYPLGSDKMLIYRVIMKNNDGLQATGAGKMMLNKY